MRLSPMNPSKLATDQVKEIALELLKRNTGKTVTMEDIKEEVGQVTMIRYSSPTFSVAMRDLVDENSRVIHPDVGVYYYIEDNVKRKEVNSVILDAIKKLDELAVGNILQLSSSDIETIHQIPELKDKLRDLLILK